MLPLLLLPRAGLRVVRINGTDPAKLDRDGLVALVLKQAATIEVLTAGVEELTRSGKPRAAPSSKGTRSKHPKKPARKPGEGTLSRRIAPSPEQLSEPPIELKIAEQAWDEAGLPTFPRYLRDYLAIQAAGRVPGA